MSEAANYTTTLMWTAREMAELGLLFEHFDRAHTDARLRLIVGAGVVSDPPWPAAGRYALLCMCHGEHGFDLPAWIGARRQRAEDQAMRAAAEAKS